MEGEGEEELALSTHWHPYAAYVLPTPETSPLEGERERREEEAELPLMSAFNFIQICYSFSQNGRGVLATFTASAVDTHSRRGQARPITISLAFRPTIIGKQHFLRLQIE